MKSTDTLRVHVVENRLWYQDIGPEPILYGDIAAFVQDKLLDNYNNVRMVGMHCNAELITKLYEAKRKVEVCTPLIVERWADRRKPGPVLFELGLCSWSPSQGGFHTVTEVDYNTYALVAALSRPCSEPTMLSLLHKHPAWKPLSFIRPIPKIKAAVVLASVIDPRWFIHLAYPDRPSKFHEGLGLNMHTQARVTLVQPSARLRGYTICDYVLDCWKDVTQEPQVQQIFELAGIKPIADSIRTGLAPWDFCWRTWAKYKDPVKADLRGSQRFADFLRQTWLSEIYRGAKSTPEERAALFRPADFFKFDEEVHAYEQHAAKSL